VCGVGGGRGAHVCDLFVQLVTKCCIPTNYYLSTVIVTHKKRGESTL